MVNTVTPRLASGIFVFLYSKAAISHPLRDSQKGLEIARKDPMDLRRQMAARGQTIGYGRTIFWDMQF
jgi:hypothetical protein